MFIASGPTAWVYMDYQSIREINHFANTNPIFLLFHVDITVISHGTDALTDVGSCTVVPVQSLGKYPPLRYSLLHLISAMTSLWG